MIFFKTVTGCYYLDFLFFSIQIISKYQRYHWLQPDFRNSFERLLFNCMKLSAPNYFNDLPNFQLYLLFTLNILYHSYYIFYVLSKIP